MLPHPDTVCQMAMVSHRQLQAEAARERLAAQAVATSRSRPSRPLRARQRLGAVLAALGGHLQGAPGIGYPAEAAVLADSGPGGQRLV